MTNEQTVEYTHERQPWMHDMRPLVCAPAQLWADARGVVDSRIPQAGGSNISGLYMGDTRVLSGIIASVDGEELTPISWRSDGVGKSLTSYVARSVTGVTVDPAMCVTLRTSLHSGGVELDYKLSSMLDEDWSGKFEVELAYDMSTMQEIKGGARSSAVLGGELSFDMRDGESHVSCRQIESTASASLSVSTTASSQRRAGYSRITHEGNSALCSWDITVPARGTVQVTIRITIVDHQQAAVAAQTSCAWEGMRVNASDYRLAQWVNTSLADLQGLRMSVPALANDEFLAAGAPWFFTLFGRDSLWAARFMLPLTTRTAMGTLRTLAHFQADSTDIVTDADPGKIMHELRSTQLVQTGAFDNGTVLPPLYYGTIDATELWVILLAEAYTWGAPRDEVRELIPHMIRALEWMRDYGDSDGDGFLEYVDRTGRGLSNQGWKDSGDSVRWNDGTLAQGPIALCEVQGYAYQAAIVGARLLDDFGYEGADEWRAWAERLKDRFNASFWVYDDRGRFPAIALDKDKKPVDSVTSNIGHLLGTGILDADSVRDVVARLMSDDMLSRYGIRTMSSVAGGFWPQSYHCGSVWAHDTAIAMNGLRAEGYVDEAVRVAESLVSAAAAFNYQIPELYSAGDPRIGDNAPVSPYPAACHPQAWSAASAVSVLALVEGYEPTGGGVVSHPLDVTLAQGVEVLR